jgi:hypothetical protein
MNGKIVGGFIVLTSLVAGIAMYYLQVYAFYEKIDAKTDTRAVMTLVSINSGQPETIPATGLQAIDAQSSPIRFRSCFSTPLSLAMLSETYVPYEKATPLNAPGWFDCFDAGEITEALASGAALAFLAQPDVSPGIDRVIAVMADGRAFAWQQVNPSNTD